MKQKAKIEKSLRWFIQKDLKELFPQWKGYEFTFILFEENQIRILAVAHTKRLSQPFLPLNHFVLKPLALAAIALSNGEDFKVSALQMRCTRKKVRFQYLRDSETGIIQKDSDVDLSGKSLVLVIRTLVESISGYESSGSRFVVLREGLHLTASATLIISKDRLLHHEIVLNSELENLLIEFWACSGKEEFPILSIPFDPELNSTPEFLLVPEITNGKYIDKGKIIVMDDLETEVKSGFNK